MISIIAATSENGIIGKDNRLPWHLPADLEHFKELTMGHHMIMGRKTWESIGRALSGRISIVVTRQNNYQAKGSLVAHSVEEAIKLCEGDEEIFVIGGASIYREVLGLADRIYLTIIHADFAGDTKMFGIDDDVWKEVSRDDRQADERNKYSYSFLVYERR